MGGDKSFFARCGGPVVFISASEIECYDKSKKFICSNRTGLKCISNFLTGALTNYSIETN
jgi:hypothetical protein